MNHADLWTANLALALSVMLGMAASSRDFSSPAPPVPAGVAASPVDPQATRKSIPDSTCQSTSARRASSSTDPFTRKGVTIAVPQPVVSIQNQFISAA